MSTTIVPTDKSQLTRAEINRKQKEYIFPSVSTYYSDPLPMDHASMQHVWDVEGKKYLDFFGGIVTISVGHCNPRVTSRTKEQIDRMQHVSTCFPNVNRLLLSLTQRWNTVPMISQSLSVAFGSRFRVLSAC